MPPCGDVNVRTAAEARARAGDAAAAEGGVAQGAHRAAERTGVVVDLRDAEVARLELLNEALDPLFAEIPAGGRPVRPRHQPRATRPRLWIDVIAHVAMGRDKRLYRFVQDTRYGRKVLAESVNIPEIVEAVTNYVAQRLIERERALAEADAARSRDLRREARFQRRRRRRARSRAFVFGVIAGFAALVAARAAVPRPRR